MPSKFKVGDRVYHKIGKFVGSVTKIYKQGCSVDNSFYLSKESELELVEEPKSMPPEFWEEPKTEKKEWPCKHIEIDGFRWLYKDFCHSESVKAICCQFCGAERPKEKEALEDVLIRAHGTWDQNNGDSQLEHMAHYLSEHLKSKEGDIIRVVDGTFGNNVFSRQVAKQILKTLGVDE